MAGIRRTDGQPGCPPTETPPADYKIPFRLDDDDAFWLRECFEEFHYFGAARHDIPTGIRWIGSAECPVDSPDLVHARGMTTGKYRNVLVTNKTQQPMQILLGLDCTVDIIANYSKLIVIGMISRWNGVYQSSSRVSPPSRAFTNKRVRQTVTVSANAHDLAYETTSPAVDNPTQIVLQPGESGTVSAKLAVYYLQGQPDGKDVIVAAESAVRVYGHAL